MFNIWWFMKIKKEAVYYGTPSQPLSTARSFLAATTVGNYAMFGGGRASGGYFSSVVDAYSNTLVRQTGVSSLTTSRHVLAATTVGSYALFGGGRTGSTTYSDNVNAYDDELVRYTDVASLGAVKSYLTATAVANYALFGGGANITGGNIVYFADVEVYDDMLVKQTGVVPLDVGRYDFAATTVGDSVIFGGGIKYNEVVTNTVDAYDSTLVKQETITSLSAQRRGLAATTVGNYALFGGGENINSTTYYNTVDVYTVS